MAQEGVGRRKGGGQNPKPSAAQRSTHAHTHTRLCHLTHAWPCQYSPSTRAPAFARPQDTVTHPLQNRAQRDAGANQGSDPLQSYTPKGLQTTKITILRLVLHTVLYRRRTLMDAKKKKKKICFRVLSRPSYHRCYFPAAVSPRTRSPRC